MGLFRMIPMKFLSPRQFRGLLGTAALLLTGVWAQQPAATTVGTIEGNQVRLKGAVQVQAGHLAVASGTEIDVLQGDAELHLQRGGTVHICGPARLTVIAGGGGAMLLSLQQGGIRLRYASAVPDQVLTPDFRVTTVVPPGQYSSTSASLALDAHGQLCVHNLGSALTLQTLDGTGHNIIAGDQLLFQPSSGAASTVPSCSCNQPAPAAVAETQQQKEAVGSLFPQGASLKYSTKPAPAVPGQPSAAPPSTAAPAPAKPAHPHHRNFFSRIFGWLFGHR
jgi:hypothetical protein